MRPATGQQRFAFAEEVTPAAMTVLCPRCATASPVKRQFSVKDVYHCPRCEKSFEVLTPRRAALERRRPRMPRGDFDP
jgi:hypothetical protein